jgi:hypothetical protein
VASVLEFLPHLSPAAAALLFPLWLVYRLIRAAQEASLRERFGRTPNESAIVSCAAYVGIFLGASLILGLAIFLVCWLTASEPRVTKAVPHQESIVVQPYSAAWGIRMRTTGTIRCTAHVRVTISHASDRASRHQLRSM